MVCPVMTTRQLSGEKNCAGVDNALYLAPQRVAASGLLPAGASSSAEPEEALNTSRHSRPPDRSGRSSSGTCSVHVSWVWFRRLRLLSSIGVSDEPRQSVGVTLCRLSWHRAIMWHGIICAALYMCTGLVTSAAPPEWHSWCSLVQRQT